MPYVHRKSGAIVSISRWPNGSQEFLSDNDPEVIEFKKPTVLEQLQADQSKVEFIAEDILHVLLQNGTIGADDLDPGVVGVLASRRALRGK